MAIYIVEGLTDQEAAEEEAAATQPLCKVFDCKKLHHSKGYCKFHYDRWRQDVPFHAPMRGQHEKCQVPLCNSKPHAQNLCKVHYHRFLRWRNSQ